MKHAQGDDENTKIPISDIPVIVPSTPAEKNIWISSFSLTILFLTRNLLKGYVATAGGVQEMQLNTQIKHCSAKHEK